MAGPVCSVCGRQFLSGDRAIFEGRAFVHEICLGQVHRGRMMLRLLGEIEGGSCYACLMQRLQWRRVEAQSTVFWLRGRREIVVRKGICRICERLRTLVRIART